MTSSWFILKYSDIYFYYIGELFNKYIFTFSLTWYKFIFIIICYIRLNLKINKYVDSGPKFGGPLEEYFKTQVWKTHQTQEEFQAEATAKAKQAAKEEEAEYNFNSDKSTSDKSTSDKSTSDKSTSDKSPSDKSPSDKSPSDKSPSAL